MRCSSMCIPPSKHLTFSLCRTAGEECARVDERIKCIESETKWNRTERNEENTEDFCKTKRKKERRTENVGITLQIMRQKEM